MAENSNILEELQCSLHDISLEELIVLNTVLPYFNIGIEDDDSEDDLGCYPIQSTSTPEKDDFRPGKHQLTPNSKLVNQPLSKRFQQCDPTSSDEISIFLVKTTRETASDKLVPSLQLVPDSSTVPRYLLVREDMPVRGLDVGSYNAGDWGRVRVCSKIGSGAEVSDPRQQFPQSPHKARCFPKLEDWCQDNSDIETDMNFNYL
ncbi:Hypothetical predicted protein [Paramuricea clavata]|uniref:Uncharacterized protein n=1 Tax=Paramuricea clavata TaxID=317549 RepID=A0A7D9DHD3_PARCT|nr:Hypothetical predicted protein [Paramuricea clavata]